MEHQQRIKRLRTTNAPVVFIRIRRLGEDQPSHGTATILDAASNRTRCITVAMHGTSHVEPVILGGAVRVRRLSEVVALLQGHGVHVPQADQQGGVVLAAVTTVISDDDVH